MNKGWLRLYNAAGILIAIIGLALAANEVGVHPGPWIIMAGIGIVMALVSAASGWGDD